MKEELEAIKAASMSQRPLTDRRRLTTEAAWLFDPWMHRWMTSTRMVCRKYRVTPRTLS